MTAKAVKWDFTARCNMRCRHCSVGKQYFTGRVQEATLEQKVRIVDKLSVGGVDSISFLGGEPLFCGNDFFVVVKRAKEHGIRVTLVSNGLLLTEANIDRLIETRIDTVVVSLDGSCDSAYAPLRGKGVFPRVIRNLRVLASTVRNSTLPINIKVNTVINKKNVHDVEKLYELLCDIQIHEWAVLALAGVGFAEDNLEQLSLNASEQIEVARALALKYAQTREKCPFVIAPQFIYPLVNDYLEMTMGVRLPDPQICCTAAISLGFISPDGILYPCDRVANEYVGRKIGNAEIQPLDLVEREFYEIWNSDYFKNMFQLIVDDETYRAYEPCNRCRYLYSRRCNPCPLYALDGKVRVETCEIAAAELGDITRDGKEDVKSCVVPSTRKSHRVNHERSQEKASRTLVLDNVPNEVNGIRAVTIKDSLVLLNPYTLKRIGLNETGALLWRMMGEQRSVSQIASAFAEATAEALGQNGRTGALDEIKRQTLPSVSAFFRELSTFGFVEMLRH